MARPPLADERRPWPRAHQRPWRATVRMLVRLADAIQVSTDYLLGRKDKDAEFLRAAVALVGA
jgi:hypothetical protein